MYRFATPLVALALVGLTTAPVFAAQPATPDRKPAKAVTTLVNRAEAPECAFTGKRVVSLLSRDDVVAATEFHEFYQAFDCPVLHLAAAFGCAVDVPEGVEEPVNDRVERCWEQPSSRPLPVVTAPPAPGAAPAEGDKPADAAAEPKTGADQKPAAANGAAAPAQAPAKAQ